jgi:hypothetical protein
MRKAVPFPLQQVRLLDGAFKQAMERDLHYLLQLEPDRFLHTFRQTAGLATSAVPLGGWESEDCELRGHSLGHYLSACSLLFASGASNECKARVDAIVAELAIIQDALPSQGYHPGYLSAYPEEFFDRVDQREPVWAPYYTLHKILAGLLDAYELCGNQQALQILEKLAGWLQFRVGRLSLEEMQISLLMEPGGITEALANLYRITGKPEHLQLLLAFTHEHVLAPLARGEDQLDRLHANTQIPKAIGAALQYEVSGDLAARRAAEFFWERVALARSYAIGGHSDDELFFPVDRFAQHLTAATAETCNTYNMLKLTRHLFSWEPSARTMDFYERGLFNHILGSQDPESGMMIYFASHKPGHFKIYNTPDQSFWCCTGTGMENHAKYADTIYFHDDSSLYVNLFIASELNWHEKGLIVRQETHFPEEDTTRLSVSCQQPVRLAFKIRYPSWAHGIEIAVNGQPVIVAGEPGSYLTIEREWHNGDSITIRLPMDLHLEHLPGEANLLAVMAGPIVLVGALGSDDLPSLFPTERYTRNNPLNFYPSPAVPALRGSDEQILQGIAPVAGAPLTFRTQGIGDPQDVQLIPFYRMHHQRYTIYWQRV